MYHNSLILLLSVFDSNLPTLFRSNEFSFIKTNIGNRGPRDPRTRSVVKGVRGRPGHDQRG